MISWHVSTAQRTLVELDLNNKYECLSWQCSAQYVVRFYSMSLCRQFAQYRWPQAANRALTSKCWHNEHRQRCSIVVELESNGRPADCDMIVEYRPITMERTSYRERMTIMNRSFFIRVSSSMISHDSTRRWPTVSVFYCLHVHVNNRLETRDKTKIKTKSTRSIAVRWQLMFHTICIVYRRYSWF
jgi:hypothetical protein